MQNALVIKEKLAEFTLEKRPIPKAGAGEVLVKNRAASLNPVDWKVQKYGFLYTEFPAVLGCDVAGDVAAVGEGVTKYSVGDRIFGPCLPHPDYSAYQEYCKVKVAWSAKIPDSITYEQASTIPAVLVATYQGLYSGAPYGMGFTPLVPDGRNKETGKAILVIGGGSSVGQSVIQLAKASGFSPIITTASLKHTEKLKELGATHIIDRYIPLPTIRPKLNEILGSGIKYIFDAISDSDTQQGAFELLAPGGHLELVLPPSVPVDSAEKRVTMTYGTAESPHNSAAIEALFNRIGSLIEEGILKPCKVEVVPGGLGAIVKSLKRLENNEVSGFKLVIRPDEK
ncbi:hypothetical protein NP233_g11526 [Leucocoprinus birnbaumii]|uniref:Enoyl reductase (ER) domain-containing protein n=1 Tax=Leucocoprinus birnbaumii TaxID=56174 RepID=A0AAD5VGK9_9AGAR|nr:hypothetical protein NP233_g11526 [Leucocoprinus birnbaumii]